MRKLKVVVAMLTVAGCSSQEERGSEGQPCYADRTCNRGLICATGNLCERPTGQDARPDTSDQRDHDRASDRPPAAPDRSPGDLPACGPGKCGGCCTATGICISFNQISPNYCGRDGEACKSCSMGETCSLAGVCTKSACNAATCPGCCQGDQCLPGDTQAACGKSGGPCTACGVSQSCQAGTCIAKSCDATSCPAGCCYNGVCFPGNNASLCGKGGAACQACGVNKQCINQACSL